MTEGSDDRGTAGESRRTVLRTGGIVSGGLVLGLSGTSGTAATVDGNGVDRGAADGGVGRQQPPVGKAFMFNDEFRPGARFRVVSPVIEAKPDVEAIQEQDVWTSANTRIIEYRNTGERVSLFPIQQADVERGEVYEFSSHTLALFDRDEGIVSCEYALPASGTGGDGAADATGEDGATVEGGGKVLVVANNFYPGARFRVVSDVVEWAPQANVRGSDPFSEYDTRYGEYLNSSDEFLFYPAHSADFERGGVYVMHDEFDVTNPEGALLTADVDRVDPASLDGP